MSDRPRLIVSVVSGGDRTNILNFMRSLYALPEPSTCALHVVATVNGDDPELEQELLAMAADARWTERVDVIRNPVRMGFAANHNRVMRDRAADLYLIANDDILVRPAAIDLMVDAILRDERAAVVSPQLLEADGSIQPSTMGFPTPWRMLLSISALRGTRPVEWAVRRVALAARFGGGRTRYWSHDTTAVVDTVRGAFALVRSDAITAVGVMDEVALVGGEETEWHRRMADAGWHVLFVPVAEVTHLGGQTVGLDRGSELEYLRGWLNYFGKHAPAWKYAAVRVAAAGVFGVRWVVAALRRDAVGRRVAAAGATICRLGPRAPRVG